MTRYIATALLAIAAAVATTYALIAQAELSGAPTALVVLQH